MLDNIDRSVEIDLSDDVSASMENSPENTENEPVKQDDPEAKITESEQHENCPQPGNPDVYRVW